MDNQENLQNNHDQTIQSSLQQFVAQNHSRLFSELEIDSLIDYIIHQTECRLTKDILKVIFLCVAPVFIATTSPMTNASNDNQHIMVSSFYYSISNEKWNRYICLETIKESPNIAAITPTLVLPNGHESALSGLITMKVTSQLPSDENRNGKLNAECISNLKIQEDDIGVDVILMIQIVPLSLVSVIKLNTMKGKNSAPCYLRHPAYPNDTHPASVKDAFAPRKTAGLSLYADIITVPSGSGYNLDRLFWLFGNHQMPLPLDHTTNTAKQLSVRSEMMQNYENVMVLSMTFSEWVHRCQESIYLSGMRQRIFDDSNGQLLNQFAKDAFNEESIILGLDLFQRVKSKLGVKLQDYNDAYHTTFGSYPIMVTFDQISNQHDKYEEANIMRSNWSDDEQSFDFQGFGFNGDEIMNSDDIYCDAASLNDIDINANMYELIVYK